MKNNRGYGFGRQKIGIRVKESKYKQKNCRSMNTMTAAAQRFDLVVLPFSSCFGFFLTPYAGFLVMFSFTDLLLDTCLSAASFETA